MHGALAQQTFKKSHLGEGGLWILFMLFRLADSLNYPFENYPITNLLNAL
jgi:hypothetical protein